MENQKLGIDNLEKLVIVGAHFGNTIDEIGHTAGLAKWGHLMDLMPDVIKLGSVSFAQAKAELKDLDATERKALETKFAAEFSLKDANLEGVLEEAIILAEELMSCVTHAIEFGKKVKALKQ